MIIGINGKIGSGKDTIGDIIQKICITNDGPEFEVKKFAGKLKQIASLLTGIDVEKFEDQEFKKSLLGDEWGTVKENPLNSIPVFEDVQFNHLMSVRELLQKIGTEAMRDGLHENVWVNALFADYIHTKNCGCEKNCRCEHDLPSWIITDMRFPNELEAVRNRGGITIRVNRPWFYTLLEDGFHEFSEKEDRMGKVYRMAPKYSKEDAEKLYKKDFIENSHPSETALDDATFDYEIVNDGTIEDLIEKVKEILIKENII